MTGDRSLPVKPGSSHAPGRADAPAMLTQQKVPGAAPVTSLTQTKAGVDKIVPKLQKKNETLCTYQTQCMFSCEDFSLAKKNVLNVI